MKTTTCRLVTLALLFATTAEAQSLFNNYQLMNLAEDLEADQFDLESLSADDRKELQTLTDKIATPEAQVQSLTSKATSTVMDGMKHFTSQLEELIKDKVASFTTTLLDSEKKEVEKKHKKSHKKHSKNKKEAKKAESEDDSESEHEQEQKKKMKKKHHKKEKAPESDNEEEEEKPKHHKKHHHAHKHHEKANDEKKEEETPSLADLAKMISTLQKEQKKDKEQQPVAQQVQLEEEWGFPLPKVFKKHTPAPKPAAAPAPQPAPQPAGHKQSPEEILNRQAQMTQKKINDARLKVMNLKTSLEDAVREVKELSEMQAMTEGEMLGLHERMLAKEQALDMKLQLDYQNNLQELEKMRGQWGGAPQPMPMASMQQLPSQMPVSHGSGDMMENLMDQKRTDALLSWYAAGRGRDTQNTKVASMAKKLKRAAKLKDRAQQMQQLTGGAPSLESLRGILAQKMQNRMPSDMMA